MNITKKCISLLRRVFAHVIPVPFLAGAPQHVRLGIVAHERVHDCQVLNFLDHRLVRGFRRCHVAGTFHCQDFDFHVVKLISLEGGLLDITFNGRQLGLEHSDRVYGRVGLVPLCQHLFISVLERAANVLDL